MSDAKNITNYTEINKKLLIKKKKKEGENMEYGLSARWDHGANMH